MGQHKVKAYGWAIERGKRDFLRGRKELWKEERERLFTKRYEGEMGMIAGLEGIASHVAG